MRWAGFLLLALLALPAAAEPDKKPVITLIIDDVGDRLVEGTRAVALPGPVAFAFLPHSPHGPQLAEAAHRGGKEVMLHLPMQAMAANTLGPGAITLDMDRDDFAASFRASLRSIPHVVGVNNHMGSLLTRHPGHMAWLMEELIGVGGLFFVDSRTSRHTVAERMAREARVPALRRHVFLDHNPAPAAIDRQFQQLLTLARRHGAALAIGHPYASTLEVLERRLRDLDREGVELVSVRRMIDLERQAQGQSRADWQR